MIQDFICFSFYSVYPNLIIWLMCFGWLTRVGAHFFLFLNTVFSFGSDCLTVFIFWKNNNPLIFHSMKIRFYGLFVYGASKQMAQDKSWHHFLFNFFCFHSYDSTLCFLKKKIIFYDYFFCLVILIL